MKIVERGSKFFRNLSRQMQYQNNNIFVKLDAYERTTLQCPLQQSALNKNDNSNDLFEDGFLISRAYQRRLLSNRVEDREGKNKR